LQNWLGAVALGQPFVTAPGFMRVLEDRSRLNWAYAPINIEPSKYGVMPKDGEQWNVLQKITSLMIGSVLTLINIPRWGGLPAQR